MQTMYGSGQRVCNFSLVHAFSMSVQAVVGVVAALVMTLADEAPKAIVAASLQTNVSCSRV